MKEKEKMMDRKNYETKRGILEDIYHGKIIESVREIKVYIPEGLADEIDFVNISVNFKEKNLLPNCQRFVDREGIEYITGYKQEGSSRREEEDL